MNFLNPDNVRLVPGQSVQGIFVTFPGDPGQVGFFVRSVSSVSKPNQGMDIQLRAGVIRFNDVILVLTMIKVASNDTDEMFDIWWNYHSQDGVENFQRISEQDTITVHFYNEQGKGVSFAAENSFQRFFKYVEPIIKKAKPWTEIDFDRSVRGFCAQSYPKENLWDMIELRPDAPGTGPDKPKGADDYDGYIPLDLRDFYSYDPSEGHCIRIIPSMLEQDAVLGNPEEYLHAAPVKSVLRCGFRWVKGFPVAPIPYIPGLGLAVPPDDKEL
ncbi:MAG: hypothetical protein HY912_07715 [Desulfomonile tiedjei]|uniref:Uncharacterized protein n=1 Tax=Desulfomonile tiedjei TaxID=2358 RepID=A0A9D6UZM6_9BACT|nr:hypothetical protein [Desulfomonile tiedjei]